MAQSSNSSISSATASEEALLASQTSGCNIERATRSVMVFPSGCASKLRKARTTSRSSIVSFQLASRQKVSTMPCSIAALWLMVCLVKLHNVVAHASVVSRSPSSSIRLLNTDEPW